MFKHIFSNKIYILSNKRSFSVSSFGDLDALNARQVSRQSPGRERPMPPVVHLRLAYLIRTRASAKVGAGASRRQFREIGVGVALHMLGGNFHRNVIKCVSRRASTPL